MNSNIVSVLVVFLSIFSCSNLVSSLADLVRILLFVVFSIELIHFGLKVGDGVIYTAGNEFIKVTYGTVRAVCGVLFPRVIKVLIDLEIQTFF